ncbi:MAG TPA: cyclase family protein [Anaerolineales bacterium]
MCVPGCHEAVHRELSRRGFFLKTAAVAAAAGAATLAPLPRAFAQEMKFSKAVDLTHTTWPEFPTFFDKPQLEIENLQTLAKDGFNNRKWHIVEHTGTHMDAPYHFSNDKESADRIPVDALVAPLVVIDIADRAAQDPDAQLTAEDIKAWESKNGALPDRCCIAMNSGWDQHVKTDKFRNDMHFPGFHPDAIELLLTRNAVGIAVDTLSLDYGQSKDFKVHLTWLPAGRWGIEAIANLGQVPEAGATVVIGVTKIEGATGGPTRVIALV